MGHAIEEIALERGHEIVLRITDENLEDFNKENIQTVIKDVLTNRFARFDETFDNSESIEVVNSFKGRTILITDDDMRNTYSISAILEEKEMNVIIAGNGVEALKKLEDNPSIEIILMDIMMPDMDGYEVLNCIKEKEQWKRIPVIAITANAMSSTRDKCMSVGASAFITKPINTEQLVNLLKVWLNN